MGIDTSKLTQKQLNDLANALQSDAANLNIVAKHLRQLLLTDYSASVLLTQLSLTDEQVRIVGTRYWYGPEKDIAIIKKEAAKSGSYGSIILKHKQKILELLQ
jgi:hypothetical protein